MVVVTDPSRRSELCAACLNQEQVREAPVSIVFLAAPLESARKYHSRGKYLYSIQDATNACMMTSLLCTDKGLGTCWVGAFHDDKVSSV